jgi:predicted DNA-binding protein
MLRTTINLPVALHHQLQFLARGRRTTVADVVREFIEKGITAQQRKLLDDAFEALKAIQGITKGGRPDASTQIDEILYGKEGVWKGIDE